MSKWHYYSILFLSLALIVILWQSAPNLLHDDTKQENVNTKLFPDAYLVNSKTTQYNEEGKLYYIINAKSVHYFTPGDDAANYYALMKAPDIQFYNREISGEPTWKVSADNAKSDLDGNVIMLDNNVVLTQKNHENQDIKIFTHDLLVKTQEQYAHTDKPVMIKTPSSTTTATGLEVSLDRETVKLLSNVKSIYEAR